MSKKRFDTSLLDAALERQRAEQERERQRALSEALCLLDEWGPRYHICRAYIFGSVTRPGHFAQDSDIDIAIEAVAAEHFFAALSALVAGLGREVDLVELECCPFADKIRREGILWTQSA